MGASVTLTAPAIEVEPGGSATLDFRLRNTGGVVDEFSFAVLGDAAGWATVEPPKISLFPGAEETLKLVLRPPRSSAVPAGPMPFGLHAQAREDPAGSTVEEGTIVVGPYQEPFAELIPRTSRGSRSGAHDIAIDNRGNVRLNAELEATDADRLLKFDVDPPGVVVDPGMANFAKVRVSPVKRFWRGKPQTRPFQLFVRPEGATPITLDGSLLQEAVLPPWFLKALLALIAAIVLLVVAWLFLLKPTIESTANSAAASEAAALEDKVNDALAEAGLPTLAPEGGGGGGEESAAPSEPPEPTPTLEPGATPPPATPTPTPGGVTIPGLGSPIDGRLDGTTTTFRAPSTVFITDLVFSNPNGRDGAMVVQRDGIQLIPIKLENIRDYDLHFVTPIILNEGSVFGIDLDCVPATPCEAALFYSGYIRP